MGERSPVNRTEGLVLLLVGPLVTAGALLWGCGSDKETPAVTDTGVVNACTNDQDKTSVFRSFCAPDPFMRDAAEVVYEYKSFAELSSDCARFCVLDPEARNDPTCVNRCLKRATAGAISDTCLSCREDMVACGRKYCLAECAPGPLELKCLVCMCGDNYPNKHNCYDPYNKCSGLGFTYCQQLEAGTFDGFPPPTDAGACD